MGTCEGAFFVPEQLAFEECLGNGAAIDGRKWAVLAGASLVNRLGRHLLSGTTLPQEEHRSIGCGHLADRIKHGLHAGARAQHSLEGVPTEPLLHLPILPLQLGNMEAPLQEQLQSVHLHRFAEEIIGSGSDRLECSLLLSLSGDDHNLGQTVQGEQVRQGGESFVRGTGVRWQAEVQEHHWRAENSEQLGRRGAILGQLNLIVRGKRPPQLGADPLVVVDDQQFGFHLSWLGTGRNT